jgi:transcriptional regulator with XRE-family HTH domain
VFQKRGCALSIGNKVKELRVRLGLTQEDLADRAELSKGFISQVERDLTSPSIATLKEMLECLGTNLKDFFADTPEVKTVYKKQDMFTKTDAEQKTEIVWLLPGAQGCSLEPILLTIEPGGSTWPDHPHEGDEFGYVLSGTVTLHLGEKKMRVRRGESFFYSPKHAHHLENTGKVPARVLWISSPPSF